MIDAKRVLDAVVGASSRPGTGGTPGAGPGASVGELAAKAKDFIARNPGLAEAALMSIAGLAYQALRNHEARARSPGAGADAGASPAKMAALAGAAGFDPAHASEDD